MGWLLELLIDGIREICSQFIVDMMELVTDMFTELLSCDLSLFEELFSICRQPPLTVIRAILSGQTGTSPAINRYAAKGSLHE